MIPTPIAEVTKPLYLGAHTLARMQACQIAGIGRRKARELILPRLPVDFDKRYERRVPEDPNVRLEPFGGNNATLRDCIAEETRDRYRSRASRAADGAPTFFNRTLRIADESSVEWFDDRLDDQPIIWRLKLYGFQPLAEASLGFLSDNHLAEHLRSTFDGWIRDWIESITIGNRNYLRRAWTPWSVSLRLHNWSRYMAWRNSVGSGGGDVFERNFAREIYKNALFLRNHIEWGVGGNHLIENATAIIVAGVLLERDSWVEEGTSVLVDLSNEQFLDDGYHFERSPMYHALALSRYLTVCNLLDRAGLPVQDELRSTAEEGSTFLQYARSPDGRIPLLNDSVYDQALPLEDCLRYADAVGLGPGPSDDKNNSVSTNDPSTSSGYHWLRTDSGAMLIDGGTVGPPNLSGHSHSDTLSLLLWLRDQPVVTDTGTFGYVSGSQRDYARGVRGHNTVSVGDTEPIALGGKYLMGPRPRPTTRFETGEISLFEGRYEALPYTGPNYVHHRSIFSGDYWWLVRDTVTGHDGLPVRSRLHLHPEVDVSLETGGQARIAVGGEVAFVHPEGSTRIDVSNGPYHPHFGEALRRTVLELNANNPETGRTSLGFFVSDRSHCDVRVEQSKNPEDLSSIFLDEIQKDVPRQELSPE